MKHIILPILISLSLLSGNSDLYSSTAKEDHIGESHIFNRSQVARIAAFFADNDSQIFARLVKGLFDSDRFTGEHVFAQMRQNLSNERQVQFELNPDHTTNNQLKKIALARHRLYTSSLFYPGEKVSPEKLAAKREQEAWDRQLAELEQR